MKGFKMKVKKYVTNTAKQTTIKGFTLDSNGNPLATSYTINGAVNDTNKAVNKVRIALDPSFISAETPTVETVKEVVPIDIFTAIALDPDDVAGMTNEEFAAHAINALTKAFGA